MLVRKGQYEHTVKVLGPVQIGVDSRHRLDAVYSISNQAMSERFVGISTIDGGTGAATATADGSRAA